jgi:NADPH:quinone reductase-like Zn-dependent oxidoreductase
MTRGGSHDHVATQLDASRGTTRAVVQHRYGSPDTLTVSSVPKPIPGPDEVLVRIRAASINARDWHEMRGEPRVARLLARDTFGLRGPRRATRGTDLAGIVESVGAGVTRWQPGDAVFGEGAGTLAEHAVAMADQLAAIPNGVTFEQAAALPLAATTAHLCVGAADPAPGTSILINGASGGVGTFAIQVAKSKQMHVTAVVSPRNSELAQRLGADQVIDYTRHDFTHDRAQYDVVLDLVGNRRLRELSRVVLPTGALVLSGGGVSGKGRVIGAMQLLIWAQLSARFSGLRILTPQAKPTTFLLQQVAELVDTGQITPVIDRRFSLEETADAIRYLETQHASAKVVISPL